jgi:hexokinase
MEKVIKFLEVHKPRASDVDMEHLINMFHSEMSKGLAGEKSSLRMIPTYIEAENEFLTDVPVIAIDAGGTNFRTSLMTFNSNGRLDLGKISVYGMPGLDREVSKDEFFSVVAGNISPISGKSGRIGFCFSYPTEILPEKDGILLQFCKEVQAPEVVGQLIGKSLLKALGTPEKKIVLLNDTVATLLAGKSASFGKSYDSFIGYILGTGTNTCYIEANRNILKTKNLHPGRSMIINIESGNFGKAQRSDIDMEFDNSTMNPGQYTFEKMFSGGYFGGLCLTALKTAAAEGIFSNESASGLNKINDLSSNEVSAFVSNTQSEKGVLEVCFTEKTDRETCSVIINSLIGRSAKLVAANIAAVVLKCGKGKSPEKPILITIDGTTFYKLPNLREQFERYFNEYLSGEQKRYVEFTEVDQSSLIGAGLAALID